MKKFFFFSAFCLVFAVSSRAVEPDAAYDIVSKFILANNQRDYDTSATLVSPSDLAAFQKEMQPLLRKFQDIPALAALMERTTGSSMADGTLSLSPQKFYAALNMMFADGVQRVPLDSVRIAGHVLDEGVLRVVFQYTSTYSGVPVTSFGVLSVVDEGGRPMIALPPEMRSAGALLSSSMPSEPGQ